MNHIKKLNAIIKTFIISILSISSLSLYSTNYYVSTKGSDQNTGTSISFPLLSISAALNKTLNPGDSIIIRSGVYSYSSPLSVSKIGNSNKHIVITGYKPDIISAYPNEGRPILDFSGMYYSNSNYGMLLSYACYCDIYGIIIKGAGDNGLYMEHSSHIHVEFCAFTRNRDSGMQISSGSNNCYVINCDSYENADFEAGGTTNGGNADGFAAKLDIGDSIYFRGCRAWLNSDDGWDGYLRGSSNVWTTIENCWAWRNGYYWKRDTTTTNMNGNGIKMGGSDGKDLPHNHRVINCLAVYNKAKGFDQNNNTGSMLLYNCTAYNNDLAGAGKRDFDLNSSVTYSSDAVTSLINCTSLNGKYNLKDGSISINNNFSAPESDFESLDTTGISGHRNIDGSLPEIKFLHLSQNSSLIDAGTIQNNIPYYGLMGIPFNNTNPDLGCFEANNGPEIQLISGTNNQTIDVESPIINIVYKLSGNANGISLSGALPIGLDTLTNHTDRTFTISGIPSEGGNFNYTITTVQPRGLAKSLSGNIFCKTLLNSPNNITATATNNTVSLNWPQVENATSYNIEICTGGNIIKDTLMYFSNKLLRNTLNTKDFIYDPSKYITLNTGSICSPATQTLLYGTANELHLNLVLNNPYKITRLKIGGKASSIAKAGRLLSYKINGSDSITSGYTNPTVKGSCGEIVITGLNVTQGDTLKFNFESTYLFSYFIATIDSTYSNCIKATVNSNSYTATGLKKGLTYYYKIKAIPTDTNYSASKYSSTNSIITNGITTNFDESIEKDFNFIQTKDYIKTVDLSTKSISIMNLEGEMISSCNGNLIYTKNLRTGIYIVRASLMNGLFRNKSFIIQ